MLEITGIPYASAYLTKNNDVKFFLGVYIDQEVKTKLSELKFSTDGIDKVVKVGGLTKTFMNQLKDAGLTRISPITLLGVGIEPEEYKSSDGRVRIGLSMTGFFGVRVNGIEIYNDFDFDSMDAALRGAPSKSLGN